MTNNLLSRLKAATCGSRELDAEIHSHLRSFKHPVKDWDVPFVAKQIQNRHLNDWFAVTRDVPFDEPGGYAFKPPNFTTSLDAALALVREVLPGWDWLVTRDGTFSIWTELMKDNRPVEHFEVSHKDRAIAACIALLTALEAEGGDDA